MGIAIFKRKADLAKMLFEKGGRVADVNAVDRVYLDPQAVVPVGAARLGQHVAQKYEQQDEQQD